ncbi:hypothetical protein M2152_000483 [Microbacteriaceae bacterium SG_E_30_P1]|uniref:VCBS repeat-containing protein n=1 Tax=Antiquaquibacter oligotrophicus TaxID=2880260 RepID=A0ABT6KK27_9MICO|nr:Ig-like domain-containing protein [Antiquaquibacter oligotrophicus]MDH6180301.1 hypothetical protein [Antiquaquibacter oligotrophicus]UDF13952.1 carboxypeptidase regulatory-like domain-containing protein [Antiquaquibacter oligotrophicus]
MKTTTLLAAGTVAALSLALVIPASIAIADETSEPSAVTLTPVAEAPSPTAVESVPEPEATPLAAPTDGATPDSVLVAPVVDETAPQAESSAPAPATPSTDSESTAESASVPPTNESPTPERMWEAATPEFALSAGTRDLTFTITDPSGDPVLGAEVVPHHVVNGSDVSIFGFSNTSGVATVTDVPWGTYRFEIQAPEARLDLRSEWWGDAYAPSDAVTATIAATGPVSFAVQLDASPSAGNRSITGVITGDHGQPVPHATIDLYRFGQPYPEVTTVADEDGSYAFRGLGDGVFELKAWSYGYFPMWFGGQERVAAISLPLNAATPVALASVELPQYGGMLRAKVLDPYGAPVKFAQVQLYPVGGDNLVSYGSTDSLGYTLVSALDVGDYEVKVIPQDESLLAEEWWQDSAIRNGSSVISVANDSETTITVELNYAETIANPDNYGVQAGETLFATGESLTVLANDYGMADMTVALMDGPDHAAGFELAPNGEFQYDADSAFEGNDTFTYRAVGADGLESTETTVTIEVFDDTPDLPVAVDDFYSTMVNTLLVVDAPGVLANDVPGGQPIDSVHELVEDTEHGTLVLNPDGSFAYEPDPGFVGVDTFRYSNEDGDLRSEPGTVTITVGVPPHGDDDTDSSTDSNTESNTDTSTDSADKADKHASSVSGLAFTGVDLLMPTIAALLVLAAGVLLAIATRRKRGQWIE